MRHGYERWRSGEVIDISRGGLRCSSTYEFSTGDTVYFLLSLDNDESISVDATAIHTQNGDNGDFETGFAFTRFYDGSEAVLHAYMDADDDLAGCRDENEA